MRSGGAHAVCRSEGGDALSSRHRATVGELRVAVVLADEQHRQIPDSGQVRRLVEGALVDGSLAEKGDRHAVTAEQAAGERRACCKRQARSDDRVRAENALARVGNVHRAALALAEPRRLAEELGHGGVEVRSFCKAVTVAAVRRRDPVVVTERRAHTDRDRLLAEGGVNEPGDLSGAIEARDALLERADQTHPGVELHESRFLVHLDRHAPSPRRLAHLAGITSTANRPVGREGI